MSSRHDYKKGIRIARDICQRLFKTAANALIRAVIQRVLNELHPVVYGSNAETHHFGYLYNRHGNMARAADDHLFLIA